VTLEMDLAENIYSRFVKKGKSLKDKNSYSTTTQSNTKTRTSWNISGQNIAGSSANQVGSIGRYLPESNAAITTPVLSTMLN